MTSGLLKTKFHPPNKTSDFIERENLNFHFNRLKEVPIMLVSAPAGYGKSAVVANFLCQLPNDHYTWVSLSENEDDFRLFLEYFIGGLQLTKPEFAKEIYGILQSGGHLDPEILANLILEAMSDWQHVHYLTLDDYHLVRNKEIHEFIKALMRYPLPNFKLIIITRRDPNLPLTEWRTKFKLSEIRSRDLKFNDSEVHKFLDYYNVNGDDYLFEKINSMTDGWISGLKMILLSSNGSELSGNGIENDQDFLKRLTIGILEKLDENIKNWILRISIIDEFNSELFRIICLDKHEDQYNHKVFPDFVQQLRVSNLFIISLDHVDDWFRFHHLFTDQIRSICNELIPKAEIELIKHKAAQWYASNEQYHNAIKYYLEIDDVESAIEVFKGYRLDLTSKANFSQLLTTFSLFDEDSIGNHSLLMLTKSWMIFLNGNIPLMGKYLVEVERQIDFEDGINYEEAELYIGEINAMKAYDRYLANIDIEACYEHSDKSIKLLNGRNLYALGLGWIFYGASTYIKFGPEAAKKLIYNGLESNTDFAIRSQLLLILSYIGCYDGDLPFMEHAAQHLIDLGVESGQNMAFAHGYALKGCALFWQGKHDEADLVFSKCYENRYFGLPPLVYPAIAYWIHIKYEKGNAEYKDQLNWLDQNAIRKFGAKFIKIVESLKSDLNWINENNPSGLRWARENDFRNYLPLADLYLPELVQLKLLLFDKSGESLKIAQELIYELIPFFKERNYNNCLIPSYIAQSILYDVQGNKDKSLKHFQDAVKLAASGNFVQPFLEYAPLIENQLIVSESNPYISRIRKLIKLKANGANGALELSKREKQILGLLESGVTNKELGNKLFISEKTVKRHIANIYKKFNSSERSVVIDKAKASGLL